METASFVNGTHRGELRFFFTLACVMVAIILAADKRREGRVHPAWLWGIGVVVVIQIIADLIAYSDAGIAFTEQFLAGTPGAARPMGAFFPAP